MDDVRHKAFDEAMAFLSGRKGLRSHMSDEAIRQVEQYGGPVVAGSSIVCTKPHFRAQDLKLLDSVADGVHPPVNTRYGRRIVKDE